MTSNRSFFNPRLLRETMKRNVWATALSFIGFFFCMPLPVAMLIQNRDFDSALVPREDVVERTAQQVGDLLSCINPFVKLGMCIMAVLCGVALFSYLHSRQRVDFYHALPVRRGALFVNNYVAGLLAVLPGYLVMYALGLAFAGMMGVGGALSARLVGKALLINILYFLLIYTVSALASILTGNTILAVLLDAWMLFSIPGAALLLGGLCEMYLSTWTGSSVVDWFLTYTSPVILYFMSGTGASVHLGGDAVWVGTAKVLAAVFVLWLALTALACVLFQRRKSERAGTAIAFQGLKPPLKWYMVLCIALLFGIVFRAISGEFWIWFGLLAGTVLGHILIEILYHFDLRAAFAHWKTMIVLAVAAVAIVMGIQRDVLGYDTWLPKEDKIQAVGISADFDVNGGEESERYTYSRSGVSLAAADAKLTDPEVIHAVYALAQKGVEQVRDQSDYSNSGWLNITYDLGGRTVGRSYNIRMDENAQALLSGIRFNEDYVRYAAAAYRIDLEQELAASSLRLSVRTNADPSDTVAVEISEPQQAAEIVRALQEETLTLTPEQAASTVPALRIDATYMEQNSNGQEYTTGVEYIPVYPTYTKTLALIQQYGGIQPRALTAADLKRIEVSWSVYGSDAYEIPEGPMSEEYSLGSLTDGAVMVTDAAQMEALLQNALLEPVAYSCDASYPTVYHNVYTVTAIFKNNRACTLYYRAGSFPEEMCESLRVSQGN